MDKNALQSSVEVRVPFLDPELVALIVNLPLKARIGPQPKGILRDVARRSLPARVARRPKRIGLSPDTHRLIAPARPGFLEDGRLREILAVPAADWRQLLRDLTSLEAARAHTAEIWCRLFLDGQGAHAVEAELWG
jgi:asparagine synthetase B (glutamine-hydrolysing)